MKENESIMSIKQRIIAALLAAIAMVGIGVAQAQAALQEYDVQVSAGHFDLTLDYNGTTGNIAYGRYFTVSIPSNASLAYTAKFQVYTYINGSVQWVTRFQTAAGGGVQVAVLPGQTKKIACTSPCALGNAATDGWGATDELDSRWVIAQAGGTTTGGVVYRYLFAPSS